PCFEESIGLDGGSKVKRQATMAKNQCKIESFVFVSCWLMDGRDDGLAVIVRQRRQEFDERGCVVGGKAARWFIKKKEHRIGDQLHRDVYPFALSTAQDLVFRSADL